MNKICHELKTLNKFFELSWNRKKTYEIRYNDRNFKVEDKIKLREINESGIYTGRVIEASILDIFSDPEYVKEDFVILQLYNIINLDIGLIEE